MKRDILNLLPIILLTVFACGFFAQHEHGPEGEIIMTDDAHDHSHDEGGSSGGSASSGGGSSSSGGSGSTGGQNIVVFRIKAGLGSGTGSLNPDISQIQLKKGGILRIINDDSVTHQIHASGNPVDHQSKSIPPGGSADLPVRSTQVASVYCHTHGTKQPMPSMNVSP